MSPAKKPKRVAIYCRVSQMRDRDAEVEGGTAQVQEERCRHYLMGKNYKPGKVYIDLDESGGDTSRPQFDEMLASFETGEHDGVCCLNLSRFGRNRNVAGDIIDLVENREVEVTCVEDNIDTSTASGKLMLDVIAAFNTYYLESTKAGWKATHKTSIGQRGVHPIVIPGYRRPDPIGGYAQPLEVDEEAAAVIRAAYELRASGATWQEVADLLTTSNIPTPERKIRRAIRRNGRRNGTVGEVRRSQAWRPKTVAKLFESRAYLGTAFYGLESKANAHPAIVSRALWRKVNPHLSPDTGERLTAKRRVARNKHLLDGLLTCAGCGRYLSHLTTVRKGGETYPFYGCPSPKSECQSKAAISAPRVERYLLDAAYAIIQVLSFQHKVGDEVEGLDAAVAQAEVEYRDACEFLGVPELPTESRQAVALQEARDRRADATGGRLEDVVWDFVHDPELQDAIENEWPLEDQRFLLQETLRSVAVRAGRGQVEERLTVTARDGSVYTGPEPYERAFLKSLEEAGFESLEEAN